MAPISIRPASTSCASRVPCGPEKEKSARRAMPRSKSSTCSGSASTERTRCRSWTRGGIDAGERAGEEVGLLLVVPLEADPVARLEDRLEERRHLCGLHPAPAAARAGPLQARAPAPARGVPGARHETLRARARRRGFPAAAGAGGVQHRERRPLRHEVRAHHPLRLLGVAAPQRPHEPAVLRERRPEPPGHPELAAAQEPQEAAQLGDHPREPGVRREVLHRLWKA